MSVGIKTPPTGLLNFLGRILNTDSRFEQIVNADFYR